MFLPLALALTVATDPRPALVELQLAGRPAEALALADRELRERPEAARQLGLDYARGNLLSMLGRTQEAGMAFAVAMAATPKLALYGRYRLALEQDRQGHPEVAAGLVATVAANPAFAPGSPLLPDAVRLLARTLAAGGDCKVLRLLQTDALPALQRRELSLAQADCALRTGFVEMARGLLMGLLREEQGDDFARGAAERLASMVSANERGPLPMLLGFTFHQHHEFDRASSLLRRALGAHPALTARQVFDAQLALGRALLSQQQLDEASTIFASLVARARTPAERAEGLFYQGQTFEMDGKWSAADTSFRQAFQALPATGRWPPRSLLAALRIEWRTGAASNALGLYELLWNRPEWRREACRAALFLAASDLAQGRRERARPWLERTTACDAAERLEASYWRGRLAELTGNPGRAVGYFLEVLRAAPYHPLAHSAAVRLAQEPVASLALAEGRRLAASTRVEDLHGAWLLLRGEEGREARKKLEKRLAADRTLAPYLTLAQRPVQRWPLWSRPLARSEEMLLALGSWHEGASEVVHHFPLSDPSLAFTGADLLARGGELERAIAAIEGMRERVPQRFPAALLPRAVRRLQYPFLYRETIIAAGRIRGVPTPLLAALIREESRFEAAALSPATARGLTQLSLPTAQRLAAQLNLARLEPEDLYRPELSIALGAAHLGILLKQFGGFPHLALTAYAAGEREAILWRRYCFGAEPEEYYAKIGTDEARDYVRRVLTAQSQYTELYP